MNGAEFSAELNKWKDRDVQPLPSGLFDNDGYKLRPPPMCVKCHRRTGALWRGGKYFYDRPLCDKCAEDFS